MAKNMAIFLSNMAKNPYSATTLFAQTHWDGDWRALKSTSNGIFFFSRIWIYRKYTICSYTHRFSLIHKSLVSLFLSCLTLNIITRTKLYTHRTCAFPFCIALCFRLNKIHLFLSLSLLLFIV